MLLWTLVYLICICTETLNQLSVQVFKSLNDDKSICYTVAVSAFLSVNAFPKS